jgi:hypothetical protein
MVTAALLRVAAAARVRQVDRLAAGLLVPPSAVAPEWAALEGALRALGVVEQAGAVREAKAAIKRPS